MPHIAAAEDQHSMCWNDLEEIVSHGSCANSGTPKEWPEYFWEEIVFLKKQFVFLNEDAAIERENVIMNLHTHNKKELLVWGLSLRYQGMCLQRQKGHWIEEMIID